MPDTPSHFRYRAEPFMAMAMPVAWAKLPATRGTLSPPVPPPPA